MIKYVHSLIVKELPLLQALKLNVWINIQFLRRDLSRIGVHNLNLLFFFHMTTLNCIKWTQNESDDYNGITLSDVEMFTQRVT